ncbi:translesion DNA synthesis-associated protein ImuA [Granulosicoccaceae sp. 1_MG-2023]|nr:translesion DNA synthesis-associated protein ImuA [Granulosicoccaceae sp. 1_MG-2023]
MNPALEALLQSRRDLWQGDRHPGGQKTRASGFAELDAILPGGGWPAGSLTELLPEQPGIGELSLCLPLLAGITGKGSYAALVASPHTPYAPALAAAGVDLSRLWILDPGTPDDTLWASEQLLRAGAFGAVLFWAAQTRDAQQRRLQLAAESSDAIAICYRPGQAAASHSAAALRLHLQLRSDALHLHTIKARSTTATRHARLSIQRLFAARRGH